MAKTTKRIRRTVSDLDAMSIESFLNGEGSSYNNSYESYSSYTDPILGQEAVDILSDGDTDHGTYMMNTMEALNEANSIALSLENYINTRKLKIKMCNAFAKAAKKKGYGLEAIDFWRSMESDDDDDKEKSKDDDKWYKNAWEAIKAFFKKIILAVINFIKTIGNFIKGAVCKAQDLFYKKYAKDISKHATAYVNNSKNDDIKYKIRAASEKKLWEIKPWEYLKQMSSALVLAFSAIHTYIMKVEKNAVSSKDDLDANTKVIDMINPIYTGIKKSDPNAAKKLKEQAGKWFPSAKKIINETIYGKENPSKHEVPLNVIFGPENDAEEILSPAALTAMTFAFKTAQQANKSLNTALKVIEKMSRQNKAFEGDSKTKKGRASIEAVNDAKRMSQFTTTLLIQLYGTCLSARMAVFGAAKKLFKKGEYDNDVKYMEHDYMNDTLNDSISKARINQKLRNNMKLDATDREYRKNKK